MAGRKNIIRIYHIITWPTINKHNAKPDWRRLSNRFAFQTKKLNDEAEAKFHFPSGHRPENTTTPKFPNIAARVWGYVTCNRDSKVLCKNGNNCIYINVFIYLIQINLYIERRPFYINSDEICSNEIWLRYPHYILVPMGCSLHKRSDIALTKAFQHSGY